MFWHVYPPKFGSTAFNPASNSRFALRPDRAMYYAGATPSAALWETVLRDLVPDRTSRAVVVPSDPRHIAQVRLLCDVPVLELIAPRVTELAVIPLSSAEGLALIDDALAEYKLLRVDTASLAESATPPPGVY